jgi:hypothetical protein
MYNQYFDCSLIQKKLEEILLKDEINRTIADHFTLDI